MTKNEALMEIQQLSIEEKIARLSSTDEAYVRGFIEGALLADMKQQQRRTNHKIKGDANETDN